jgi:hypothetical protein
MFITFEHFFVREYARRLTQIALFNYLNLCDFHIQFVITASVRFHSLYFISSSSAHARTQWELFYPLLSYYSRCLFLDNCGSVRATRRQDFTQIFDNSKDVTVSVQFTFIVNNYNVRH